MFVKALDYESTVKDKKVLDKNEWFLYDVSTN